MMKLSRADFIFIFLSLIFMVSWYFYRPQIINFWNSEMGSIKALVSSYFSPKEKTDTDDVVIALDDSVVENDSLVIKDCGITNAPDLKNPATYENNKVLNCLGGSALYCENAKAVLKDPLFPTMFQIVNSQKGCDFKLSYKADSSLVDITGKKLAHQYISCPLNIVKVLDETKKVPVFKTPTTKNLGQYASQIYFYGTLGLFIETNVEKSKIQALGCSGPYIDSVVASYQKK